MHSSGKRRQNRCKSCKGRGGPPRPRKAVAKDVICPGCGTAYAAIKHDVCWRCHWNKEHLRTYIRDKQRAKAASPEILQRRLEAAKTKTLDRMAKRITLAIAKVAGRPYNTALDIRGYVDCWLPSDHPCRLGKRDHRVAQHHLAWYLGTGTVAKHPQTVHHKNGIRHDNRFENLELWEASHPYGSRVVDLVEHATEVLARYAPERLDDQWRTALDAPRASLVSPVD